MHLEEVSFLHMFDVFFCRIKFANVKSHENTMHHVHHVSSGLIIFHHVSSESGKHVDNPKSDTKGRF